MTAPYGVAFDVAVEARDVPLERLEALAAAVMAGENVAPGTALAVLLTGDDEVQAMNREYLGIDAPTDVLSFADDNAFPVPAGDPPSLGDIAISLPAARRQASDSGHPLGNELDHLLVHGILHLRGFDHEASPEEEARMRAREERYLGPIEAHGH